MVLPACGLLRMQAALYLYKEPPWPAGSKQETAKQETAKQETVKQCIL